MDNVREILKGCGAILEGHFVLSSMEHSDKYIEKANLYKNSFIFDDLCWKIAYKIWPDFNIDVVAGMAPIGSVLAQRVAYHLEALYHNRVVPIFAEKDNTGKYIFSRGFNKDLRGKNVLVVDDILTTGHSVRQIIDTIINSGGNVLCVAVLCNRGDVQSDDLYCLPIISLVKVEMENWPQDKCPLCSKKVPVNRDIGRGREFLELNPSYPSI